VDYYWVYPWPVEIVNQESMWTWLGPVLTFLGSVLLFAGSLIVMRLTNKAADQRAAEERQAADRRAAEERQNERERDFRLFQRDKLLDLGDEIVEAAIETFEQFCKIRNSPNHLPEEPFGEIDVWVRKIAANVVRLRLIGALDTSQRGIELRDAINNPELRATISELDVVERTTVPAQLHDKEAERQARQEELRTQFNELMERINDARKAFSDSVERDLARTS
jgi:hypothetical protein